MPAPPLHGRQLGVRPGGAEDHDRPWPCRNDQRVVAHGEQDHAAEWRADSQEGSAARSLSGVGDQASAGPGRTWATRSHCAARQSH